MPSPSSALTHGQICAAFEAHRDDLFQFFLSRTGCAATSDDLVQDTFLRALRYRSSFRGLGTVRGWLYTIARNHLASRRARVEPVTTDLERELPDPAPGPWEATRSALDVARVRDALDHLPAQHADVLTLTRIEGLPYAEAAEALGTTEGAIKVRVFRALAALRRALDADSPVSPRTSDTS